MTAVDLLIKELKDFGYYTYNLEKLCEQAKEMEKQQQDEFAIGFFEWSVSQETLDLINDLVLVGEINKATTSKELLEIYKKEKGL